MTRTPTNRDDTKGKRAKGPQKNDRLSLESHRSDRSKSSSIATVVNNIKMAFTRGGKKNEKGGKKKKGKKGRFLR